MDGWGVSGSTDVVIMDTRTKGLAGGRYTISVEWWVFEYSVM